jgi:hypothetical protein
MPEPAAPRRRARSLVDIRAQWALGLANEAEYRPAALGGAKGALKEPSRLGAVAPRHRRGGEPPCCLHVVRCRIRQRIAD